MTETDNMERELPRPAWAVAALRPVRPLGDRSPPTSLPYGEELEFSQLSLLCGRCGHGL